MKRTSSWSGARAWWVTVLVVLGVLIAAYFIWPRLSAYWTNTKLKGIVKGKAMSCFYQSKEHCIAKIISEAKTETGIELYPEDFRINAPSHKKVTITVTYEAFLDYPFTGTMLGSDKDQVMDFKFTTVSESMM